jgi:hypothetical protein
MRTLIVQDDGLARDAGKTGTDGVPPMNSNALDSFLLPLFEGWGIGFMATAAAWTLLTFAARLWRQALDHAPDPSTETATMNTLSLDVWDEMRTRHA